METRTASFRFDPELDPFLPPARRGVSFAYPFRGRQSLKHLIEAAGVPHTEVGAVTINDQPAELATIVQDGDIVMIGALLEDVLPGPRFVLDCHLGRLAAYLRLLGFDSLYHSNYNDEALAGLAETGRILLTRDRLLLMRRSVGRGLWLRATNPEDQLREVTRRYRLAAHLQPFSRCLRCNGALQTVEKMSVLEQLQPLTRQFYEDFRRCADCSQVYWPGSHYARLSALVDSVRETFS